MPPFSGKKKKEQLQAKRQRKRDEEVRQNAIEREREKLREELVNRGEDVNDDVLDAYMRERNPDAHDPARGRRAHRRERAQNEKSRKPHEREDDGSGSDDGSDAAPSDARAEALMMYSADRHHGVRSVFAKESAAVLAARKQLSYQPIPYRTTMPANGIPFGEWFTFPVSAAATNTSFARTLEAAAEDGKLSSAEKAAMVAAEQERRMERPLVATTAEALGGGSGSVVFPFAVELPTRGWHMQTAQPPISADGLAAEVVVESNTITAPSGEMSVCEGTVMSAVEKKEKGDAIEVEEKKEREQANPRKEASSPSASGNDDGRSSNSAADEDEFADSTGNGSDAECKRSNKTSTSDAQRAEALFIRGIEQKRFDAYVRCLDAYPLPEAIAGLDISSYERNVEVWQQLWRTVEMSDVLVVVADARYPILHTHLGLLAYITKVHKKPCVLVLNKEDLVPASTLKCWQQFLFRYLSDLGFSVEPLEGPETAEARDAANARDGTIVLRSFTANPRPETAGQQDGDVDVTRRQKQRKGANAKMYEKLRSGKLNATKHLAPQQSGNNGSRGGANGGKNGEDTSSSDSDEEGGDVNDLRYSATENFVGRQAAEHALQHDRRAYKELEVVAQKITELLAVCRRLGTASRTARGNGSTLDQTSTISTVAGVDAATAAASSTASTGGAYTTSALPCAAPRPAKKNTKEQRKKKKSGGRSNKDKASASLLNGDSDAEADAADAVEDRAPDSPSYVHIGFIGHPNVGKSSLLNCIRGTKVVSVSATPGHTKHIQTIPVPEEHLTLVDSPGLALPVFGVPRPLQAVLGTHQIAQTRDPQSGVSFLAAYLPIEKLYGLQRPDYALAEDEWSSYELCEAYAKKRGYFVKHGKGALDIHRAAIAILQEAYEGRLALFYAPPELNLLQSAWYRERIRPHLLLTVFGSSLPS